MRYVAFLRAINVGKRRVKMDLLRDVFVAGGFENVTTYIASGNVIFDTDAPPLPAKLEGAFEQHVGFHAEMFLRRSSEICAILDRVPWQSGDGVVDVSFLTREPDPVRVQALESTAVAPEQITVSGAEVYFLRAGKGIPTTHKETVTVAMLGMNTTRRGLATIERINERFLLSG